MPAMKIDVNVLLATIYTKYYCMHRHAYNGTMIDYLTYDKYTPLVVKYQDDR